MPHGVTSIEKRLPQGIDRPCGENAASTIHPLKRKNRFARSARTQRSVRSRRLELGREQDRVFGKYGVVGKTPLVQCRADSVKHATSPSRRDISRRVNHVASDSTSVRRSRTSRCPAPLRRVPQSVPVQTGFELGPTHLQAPRSYFACCGPVHRSLVDAHIALEGNLGTGQPFSYCYELRTQHRLESVATRTPPPICTSAQGSQTALVLRTVERREQLITTRWLGSDNQGIHAHGDSSPTVAALHVSHLKPRF